MKWIKLKGESYFDAFKCSNCETVIVVEDEALLPDHCKACEAQAEE